MLGTRCERARPVCACTAPSGELGVVNVEGVRRDLRNVDVVQRPQIAGDDPAVLLKRVRRPATLLHRDPLLSQVAEGPVRMRSVLLAEFDLPGVRLVPCVPLPCRLDGLGRPPPSAGQGVTAHVDVGRPEGSCRTLAVARGRYAMPATRWHGWWHARQRRRPRRSCRGPLTCYFCWHPQRDSNPCRHLEERRRILMAARDLHDALVTAPRVRTQTRGTHRVSPSRSHVGWHAARARRRLTFVPRIHQRRPGLARRAPPER
jgi:hypothetical protein